MISSIGECAALQVHEIIAPISPDFPCGSDIRVNPEAQRLYYEIKDARNQARSEERTATPGEPIRLSPGWHDVSQMAQNILKSSSKDIEILAWLAEAKLRVSGFEGLRDSFAVTAELVDQFWDDLHSVDTEEIDDKVGPLAGLNGVSGEGTLIQAIRLSSLVPQGSFGRNTLWDYQLSQRNGETELRDELSEAISNAGPQAMEAYLAVVEECIAHFARLDEILVRHCEAKAPPTSNIRTALQEVAGAIRILGNIPAATPAQFEQAVDATDSGTSPVTTTPALVRGEISSREEAFEALQDVARFFRRSEPHSPISMAIETLVRRGRMDFSELLAELMPEAHARNAVLTAAGIQPDVEK